MINESRSICISSAVLTRPIRRRVMSKYTQPVWMAKLTQKFFLSRSILTATMDENEILICFRFFIFLRSQSFFPGFFLSFISHNSTSIECFNELSKKDWWQLHRTSWSLLTPKKGRHLTSKKFDITFYVVSKVFQLIFNCPFLFPS